MSGDLFTGSTCCLNLQAIEHLASVGLIEKRDLVKSQSGNYDGLVNNKDITASTICKSQKTIPDLITVEQVDFEALVSAYISP